jgi:ribosomal protein L14
MKKIVFAFAGIAALALAAPASALDRTSSSQDRIQLAQAGGGDFRAGRSVKKVIIREDRGMRRGHGFGRRDARSRTVIITRGERRPGTTVVQKIIRR